MKLNTAYLSLTLLTMFSMVTCLPTSNPDLETCKKVCDEDFLPKLDSVIRNINRTPQDFQNIEFFWGECSYHCSKRCVLTNTEKATENMRRIFATNQYFGNPGLASLASNMITIVHNLKWNCYVPWENAFMNRDEETTFAA